MNKMNLYRCRRGSGKSRVTLFSLRLLGTVSIFILVAVQIFHSNKIVKEHTPSAVENIPLSTGAKNRRDGAAERASFLNQFNESGVKFSEKAKIIKQMRNNTAYVKNAIDQVVENVSIQEHSSIENDLQSRQPAKSENATINFKHHPLRFVMHIGPGKTGTSTIQKKMQTKEIKRLFWLDNFALISHNIVHKRNFLTRKIDGSYSFSREFMNVWKTIKERNVKRHILGSSEYIPFPTEKGCQYLKDTLYNERDGSHWDPEIIITYRRLHDLLPSDWNQYYKKRRDEDDRIVGPHVHWPGENGGIHILPFDESLPILINKQKDHINNLYNNWKSCADKVTVIHYHDTEVLLQNGSFADADIMTNFVCNGVIGANYTCSFLRDGRQDVAVSNPSVELGYDIMAVHFHESGLIPIHWKRQDAVNKIKQFIQRNNITDFPMKCPNSTALQNLYEQSLINEKSALVMMGRLHQPNDALNSDQQEKFDEDWQHALDKDKFCTINAAEVIKGGEWQKFFSEVNGPRLEAVSLDGDDAAIPKKNPNHKAAKKDAAEQEIHNNAPKA